MAIKEYVDRAKADYHEVFDAGKIKGVDEFWDMYQNYGNRTDYTYAFAGKGWTDETFKPKYNIRLETANYYVFEKSLITDLKAILEKYNVVLDGSKMGYTLGWFNDSSITRVPFIDVSKSGTSFNALKGAKKLIWVDGVKLRSSCGFAYAFDAVALEHCPFSGTIGQKGFDMSQCTLLDKESLTSIINCLSSSTSGLTVTLSLVAVDKAFETNPDINNGSSSTEWLNLVNTKSNWTVSLV